MSIHLFSSLRCNNCDYTSKMCCNFHPILSMRCRMCRENGAHLCGGCGKYTATYSKLPADQMTEFQTEALKAEMMDQLREFLCNLEANRQAIEAHLNALMGVPCPRLRALLEERWTSAQEYSKAACA
jgi:hypothetical protein